MTIVAGKGSMITARTNQGQNVTRNSSFFKILRVPNGSLCSESSEQRIRVPNGSLCSESSEQREDFEPSDDIVTKDKPFQIEPVVHPEQIPELNVDPELPIIRRSTRLRKAPDVLDLLYVNTANCNNLYLCIPCNLNASVVLENSRLSCDVILKNFDIDVNSKTNKEGDVMSSCDIDNAGVTRESRTDWRELVTS